MYCCMQAGARADSGSAVHCDRIQRPGWRVHQIFQVTNSCFPAQVLRQKA